MIVFANLIVNNQLSLDTPEVVLLSQTVQSILNDITQPNGQDNLKKLNASYTQLLGVTKRYEGERENSEKLINRAKETLEYWTSFTDTINFILCTFDCLPVSVDVENIFKLGDLLDCLVTRNDYECVDHFKISNNSEGRKGEYDSLIEILNKLKKYHSMPFLFLDSKSMRTNSLLGGEALDLSQAIDDLRMETYDRPLKELEKAIFTLFKTFVTERVAKGSPFYVKPVASGFSTLSSLTGSSLTSTFTGASTLACVQPSTFSTLSSMTGPGSNDDDS